MSENFKKWFKCAVVRALKTVAQTAVSLIPVGVAINEVSWEIVASTSLLAGVLSILTSIAGLPEANKKEG